MNYPFSRIGVSAIIVLLVAPFFAGAGTHPVWNRSLFFGLRGQDVIELQNILITQGDLAAENNTGYFGRLTEAAVKKFQCRSGIVCSGTPSATGYGVVGPRTRTKLLEGFGSSGRTSANFSISPTSGAPPLEVTLSFMSSSGCMPTNTIDWGDGTKDVYVAPKQQLCTAAFTNQSKRHTFTTAGAYAISQWVDTSFQGTVAVTVTSAKNSSNLSDQMEQVYAEIKGTIGVTASDISQCRTMAIGHKLCGGPGGYLVYSLQSTNESKLKDLVTRFTALQEAYQSKYQSDQLSTCDVTIPPTVEFKNGKCAAASTGLQVITPSAPPM